MKKIIGLSVVFLLILAVAVGGTVAYFQDTETSSANTITAGTLDMSLTDSVDDGTDNETATWVISTAYPGMTEVSGTLRINNTGSLAGYLDLASISVTDAEGTNPESETNTGSTLSQLLKVWMFWDENGDATFNGADANLFGSSGSYVAFSTLHGQNVDADKLLSTSGSTYITMKITWPASANDNDAQGDITTFIFDVVLDQVAD